jgi:hypothetical protein
MQASNGEGKVLNSSPGKIVTTVKQHKNIKYKEKHFWRSKYRT